jgi:nucleoside-diphosphate-sugar epimerase
VVLENPPRLWEKADVSGNSSDDLAAAYASRSVLVTGAAGFIGSHLVERLLALGAEVSAFVRYTSRGALAMDSSGLGAVAPRLRAVVAGDLASPSAVEQIVAADVDVVFHLAADAWVTRSLISPVDVVTNNVQSTLHVLEAARRSGRISRVVVTSSSEVYGTTTSDGVTESHALEPTSPYAASKVACDRLAIAWHRTFESPVAIIRPFSTYGPRQTYDVIPKFIRAALRAEPIAIHGSGEQSRDFTYVSDMVEAFLTAGAHPDAVGRAVHYGTATAVSILTIAHMVSECTGSRSEIIHLDDRPAQVQRLRCDPGLAQRLFGWRPSVGLTEGIARTVDWIRRNEGFDRL